LRDGAVVDGDGERTEVEVSTTRSTATRSTAACSTALCGGALDGGTLDGGTAAEEQRASGTAITGNSFA
jgi:hypothetical protein